MSALARPAAAPRPHRPPGVFQDPRYLALCATHEAAALAPVSADGARLDGLDDPARGWRTPYGAPAPHGDAAPAALDALARALHGRRPSRVVLAGYDPASRNLAVALEAVGLPVLERRPLAVLDLDPADPVAGASRRARRAAATAARRGTSVATGPYAPWFGPLYRAAMDAMGADPVYRFADDVLGGLAALPHRLIAARDEHGVAAAALVLLDGPLAHYHLGARRPAPAPPLGAMNLALLGAAEAAAAAGCVTIAWGGGRTAAADDALLAFKRQFASREVQRVVLGAPR